MTEAAAPTPDEHPLSPEAVNRLLLLAEFTFYDADGSPKRVSYGSMRASDGSVRPDEEPT